MIVKSLSIEEKNTALHVKKKNYEPPVLKDWGTLQDMTLSAGFSGKADGGKVLFTKTRF
jgi:hypothetical protein